MNNYDKFFFDDYEQSRLNFRKSIKQVRKVWKNAEVKTQNIGKSKDDLTIELIEANATEDKKNLIIITTGVHGIEGYMGSAVLQLFIKEYLDKVNHKTTGLRLVHAVNPWGMKQKRRVTENNVDLNRNFIIDWSKLNKNFNKQFAAAKGLFYQEKPISSMLKFNISYNSRLMKNFIKLGQKGLSNSVLLGQYQFPKSIYYGGEVYENNTVYMIDLFENSFEDYSNIILIDIHTGYGPSYQMNIVNSSFEKRSSEELSKIFSYPLVSKTDSKEFYNINGDMVDFVYNLKQTKYDSTNLYATAFEFGTFGNTAISNLKALEAIIKENQLFWHGAKNRLTEEKINELFLSLFYPRNKNWRAKGINDARQAFEGIFRAEGLYI